MMQSADRPLYASYPFFFYPFHADGGMRPLVYGPWTPQSALVLPRTQGEGYYTSPIAMSKAQLVQKGILITGSSGRSVHRHFAH